MFWKPGDVRGIPITPSKEIVLGRWCPRTEKHICPRATEEQNLEDCAVCTPEAKVSSIITHEKRSQEYTGERK